MKKIITIALFFLPLFGFSQTVKVDTSKVKVVVVTTNSSDENELDEEYKERPFQGQEETLKITPFIGLTDHEAYNLKLKMSTKNKKPLKNSK
jgi:hypothetical protein